jgi:hypothetical protein
MYSAQKIFNTLWEELNDRQKEVLTGRFGLDKSGKSQTLAALGARYHVTRERIRQIESSGIAALRTKIANHAGCQEIIEKTRKFLKDSGGVARREAVLDYVNTFVDGLTENHLAVLIEATKAFHFYGEDRQFWAFYYTDKAALKSATSFIDQWTSHLRGRKEHVLQGKYHDFLADYLKKKNVKREVAENYLSISKRIHKNPFGDLGLSEWAEIMPKTIRDRVYLVLKKQQEPMHFRVIAKTINEISFDKHQASAPTVHNELIKDNRFVLVGRGMYALAEFGFQPGTAREVIARILKKHGPLKPKDVILAVQRERFFKPNTVLVNLQSKSFFQRQDNGTYRIREA